MVVLLDLDRGAYAGHEEPAGFASSRLHLRGSVVKAPSVTEAMIERLNPNINGFSAALGCYP